MSVRELNFTYEEFSDFKKLDPHISGLIDKAKEAARKAYAPYSKFKVGAVAELASGLILWGNNQENAAYPSGMCAERSVLFFANGNYPEIPVCRMVLVAFEGEELTKTPVYPCGACRQVMIQTQDRFQQAVEVWMVGRDCIHMVRFNRSLTSPEVYLAMNLFD